MVELLCAGALVLLIWMLVSKYSIIRTFARIFTGLLTLVSVAAAVALFIVGQKAHWTSDGPGMLLIMAGIVFCGIFTCVFGGLFFSTFNQSSSAG
jgi:hypothetical protein